MSNHTSRLAPSPTGALHLGNARTFLINWAMARQAGWSLRMRIEDLAGPRVKPAASDAAMDILAWLGLDWDGPAMHQSRDLTAYRQAMHALADARLVYGCDLSRSEIEAASSAPHGHQHEMHYPRHLRPDPATDSQRYIFRDTPGNHRFVTPARDVLVQDRFAGRRVFRPIDECGDFVIWTKRNTPAYQLAVVVDDHLQGVTDVVRGDDLLPSAARQHLLNEALGYRTPNWWHLPLVLGHDGHRLAKRHGDTRIESFRAIGVCAERIIGLLASWSGVRDTPEPMTARQFVDRFDINAVPNQQIVFTRENEHWLRDD